MIAKTVKYTDFNGNEREERLYFNLSKTELTKMQVGMEGGFDKYIKGVVESGNHAKLIEIFDELIIKAYGQKSEDGSRFIKSKTAQEEFAQSVAYDELFMEIASDEKAAVEFMNGILNVNTYSK